MALQHTYRILAPFYDLIVDRATRSVRSASCRDLAGLSGVGSRILIAGIGTGLDLPYLPPDRRYVGADLTPGMLERARRRPAGVSLDLGIADVQQLPFADATFDAVVMHLILAIVPDSLCALREAERVLADGGHIVIVDKFLETGQRAAFRRLISPVIERLGTRTNVEFGPLVAGCPSLEVISDRGALFGGWFRRIVVRKRRS